MWKPFSCTSPADDQLGSAFSMYIVTQDIAGHLRTSHMPKTHTGGDCFTACSHHAVGWFKSRCEVTHAFLLHDIGPFKKNIKGIQRARILLGIELFELNLPHHFVCHVWLEIRFNFNMFEHVCIVWHFGICGHSCGWALNCTEWDTSVPYNSAMCHLGPPQLPSNISNMESKQIQNRFKTTSKQLQSCQTYPQCDIDCVTRSLA